MDISLYLIRK